MNGVWSEDRGRSSWLCHGAVGICSVIGACVGPVYQLIRCLNRVKTVDSCISKPLYSQPTGVEPYTYPTTGCTNGQTVVPIPQTKRKRLEARKLIDRSTSCGIGPVSEKPTPGSALLFLSFSFASSLTSCNSREDHQITPTAHS